MRLVALVACVILTVFGCSARRAETRDPDMIVCGWIAGPDSLNPMTTTGAAGRMIEDELFSPLVDVDAQLHARWSTSIAQRVEITAGGRHYRLHVRRGVRWSDGQPLDARDVVFTLKLENNPRVTDSSASDFTLMQSVRALNAWTVDVRLSQPSPPFLLNALGGTLVLPQHVLQKYAPESAAEAQYINADTTFSANPVVSGPYRLLRQVPASFLILEANPTFWGPPPSIGRIAFRVYPQQDSLYAAVDAGEVDVTDIPPNLWRIHDRLRGAHKAVTWPWNVTFYLLPNFADPSIPFIRERAVRQAMLYAIDRDFIVRGIMSGQADLLDGPTPRFSPYFNRRVRRYGYDPQRARALLEASGWQLRNGVRFKNGRTLRFRLKTGGATDAVASNIAELVQANLRAVGIDCELENEEIGTFFEDLHEQRFQVALRGTILSAYPDDAKWFDSHETRAHGGYNYASYANPEADRLLRAARTAPSFAVARRFLDAWQALASQDVPVVFLYSNRLGAVVPADLEGYELSPLAPAALPMTLERWRRTSSNRRLRAL